MLPERIDRARDLCAGWVKSGHTPAIVALVARRGVIVLHEAFGKLRPEDDSPPVRLDTIWPVMSVTKPMTATIIMQLVEDGLLGLNRPVRDYLPEVTGEGTEDVLVHQLLTHTAGYDDFTFLAAHADEFAGIDRMTPDELRRTIGAMIREAPLDKPPGEVMNYSATGYFLLGEIIERVSGRSLEALMQERLFSRRTRPSFCRSRCGIGSSNARRACPGHRGWVWFLESIHVSTRPIRARRGASSPPRGTWPSSVRRS
jgi:CubicO group peptidase (beta-lactamase class C family)